MNFVLIQMRTNLILIGNKTDLYNKREVSYEEGKNFSQINRLQFFFLKIMKKNARIKAIKIIMKIIIACWGI